ncbi:glycosyltransferase family 2 protein [Mucilaginibacter koreensis]
MKISLPDLVSYKEILLKTGISYPLPLVTNFAASGLLDQLPKPAHQGTGWPWTEQVNQAVYTGQTWPKITIVTPSYNQGAFLEQTIRSVLLQNYPNLEYIIMDGGSTDESRQILDKYSQWLSYWHSERDRGQSHAINMGFALASGDYYAWLNSDDYYLPETLVTVAQNFIQSKAAFLYGHSLNYNIYTHTFTEVKPGRLLDYFLRFPTLAQPSCFWSKNIHQPLWEELHCSLDYELWLRIVKGNKRKRIKKPLSVANVHDDAKTHDPKMGEKWSHDHQLICADDAHGPVKDWTKRQFLYKILNLFP